MNPFRWMAGTARRGPGRDHGPMQLGRGPILDAMAVGARADRLGAHRLVCELDGHPRPAALPPALRTAAERSVEVLLQLAGADREAPAHLSIAIDEQRVDARLVAAGGFAAARPGQVRSMLGELRDWADAFGGDVVMLVNASGAAWVRVSLQPSGGPGSRATAAPEAPEEWDVVDVPAGPLFGDGSAVR